MAYLQAIWENQFYYLFGFLFLVFIILVVSCSQISIVMVYFQLCAEVRGTGPAVGGWGAGSSIEWVPEAAWVSHVVPPLLARKSCASTSLPFSKPPFVRL